MQKVWFHLGVSWLVWGTVYVAIAESLEGLPVFAVASVRLVLAGVGLIGIARLWSGPLRVSVRELLGAAVLGVLLIAIGDGAVIWAIRYVPSGQVAVLVATTPLFAVAIEACAERRRPATRRIAGVLCGLVGVAFVARLEGGQATSAGLRLAGVLASLLGAAAWAWATVRAPRTALPRSSAFAMGLQLVVGGLVLAPLATVRGEWGAIVWERLAGPPGVAIAYLIVLGCMLGFGSYMWLLRNVRPALATSFAFVNPVVAVVAGSLVRGERLDAQVAIGAAVVIVAVLLVGVSPRHPPPG